MKTVVGSVVAATVASACCLGPVVLSALGAGALGAAAVTLESYRPFFLGLTLVLLGAAFYTTYHSGHSGKGEVCRADGSCTTSSRRARIVLWVAAALVILLVTFPYYVDFLL